MCQVESTERFSRIRRKRLSCFNCTLSGTWNRPSLPSHSRMGRKWNMFNVLWALAAAKEGIKNSSTFVCLSNPVKEVWYEAQLRVKWKQWNQNSDRRIRRSTKKFSKVAKWRPRAKLNEGEIEFWVNSRKFSFLRWNELSWSWSCWPPRHLSNNLCARESKNVLKFPNYNTISVYGTSLNINFDLIRPLTRKMWWCWRNETSN